MEAPPSPRPPSPKPQASFFIASASPRRHIISSFPQYMIYSVPSTPAAAFSAFIASCEPNPNPPTTASETTDSDSDSDDGFSFNTGQSFRSLPPHRSTADVPADDDLFSNGLLLPLTLPPRLQASPTVSPRAPSFSLGRGFFGFGKKEVDPFEAAMELIRKEEELHCDKMGHRRGRWSFGQPIGTRPAEWAEEREEEPLAGAKRSKESKRRSWSKLSSQLSRLLALPSTKAKGGERANGIPIETKSSSRRVAAEEMRSKSVALYRRSPQGPSFLACFGVSQVSSRKPA